MLYQTHNPVFCQTFSGLIWKIQVERNGPLIGVENRDPGDGIARFSCLNIENGRANFLEESYEANGQPSLAFVSSRAIILNVYQEDTGPSTKGIISISPEDGALLWQKFNVSFHDAGENCVRVWDPRIQPRRIVCLDNVTGEPVSDETPSAALAGTLFPEEDTTGSCPVSADIVGEVMALSYRSFNIAAFHEINSGILRQRIVVYQEDRKVLDDIIISGIQKLQPEAFFIHQSQLLYIRNKNEIVSYLL